MVADAGRVLKFMCIGAATIQGGTGLSVDTSRSSWIAEAEAAIRALRDVESVSIQSDGDAIREIHVLTRSTRPPKQIVRDVQTVLLTRFNRSIDYRVVSVAYLRESAPSAAGGHEARPREAAPPPAPAPSTTPQGVVSVAERIRFGSVNLFVSGHRTQAQVELRWRGLPRIGSASGWSTRSGSHRLTAQATVAAIREFLADEVALSVQEVEFLRLGRRRLMVVSVSLLAGRQEKTLVGTCAVEQDVQQAVVLATLAALNRVVAGLRPKEPTEYILRPTPDQ